MTITEAIEKLSQIKDKQKPICFKNMAGTLKLIDIKEESDCILLSWEMMQFGKENK